MRAVRARVRLVVMSLLGLGGDGSRARRVRPRKREPIGESTSALPFLEHLSPLSYRGATADAPGLDWRPGSADVAQLVEHFTRNEGVPGSSPGVGSEKVPHSGAFCVFGLGR